MLLHSVLAPCATRRHNRLPSPPAEDASADQPLNEIDFHKGEKKRCEDSYERVMVAGPCVAAIHVPLAALVDGWRGWRGIIGPSHGSGGGGDAAHRSESDDERNDRLVEQHF